MSSKKILVLHDAFLYRGGGERLVTLMAKELNADLASGFFSEGSFNPRELGFEGKLISLGKPVFMKGLRHMILKYRFSYKAKFLENYDIIILSGNCLDVIKNIPKDTKILYYCHTPPRYIYDFRNRYISRFPKLFHPILDFLLDRQAKIYENNLQKVDIIFSNAKNIKNRLIYYCKTESTILYPPTDTERFALKGEHFISLQNLPREYYLSFSRLASPKRVDLVAKAFLQMPDKNLVFTYGVNDPMKDEILTMVKGKKNIFPIPAPSDQDFIRLIQGALATIYIPVDEDFGMSPVESMACGVPVIGVNEGGLKETILDKKTGILLPKDIQISDIQNAVKLFTKEKCKQMSKNCREQAMQFSLENFVENLKKYL
ncbi:glycosyltransferase [Candidatus Gracilibacteria bacterium]|nr:glycosyltransferase [Candidatus Gracilibacteria bacterium]